MGDSRAHAHCAITKDNSQLAVITDWQQNLVEDTSGKFIYARDADTGLPLERARFVFRDALFGVRLRNWMETLRVYPGRDDVDVGWISTV